MESAGHTKPLRAGQKGEASHTVPVPRPPKLCSAPRGAPLFHRLRPLGVEACRTVWHVGGLPAPECVGVKSIGEDLQPVCPCFIGSVYFELKGAPVSYWCPCKFIFPFYLRRGKKPCSVRKAILSI